MKRELLEKLIEITKKQQVLLEQEEVESYIELLDERQNILEQLNELYIKHPELKQQNDADLLDELKRLDEENKVEFERQFEETKRKLREVRMMKKNETQYTNPYSVAREEGVYFDKRNGKQLRR